MGQQVRDRAERVALQRDLLARRLASHRHLTLEEAADALAGENPAYGPGNPDWERDFEKTAE